MIIISEVVHNGEVHFQVNSCFVSMISILCPNEKILVRAEENHIIALRKNLRKDNLENVEFLSFDKYYDAKKYNWGSRIFGEFIQISKTLLKGRALNNKIYIWTCLFPTGHFFLNLITYFQKNKKHIIILHGELEYLKNKNKTKAENIFGRILKAGMNLSTNKNKYIVLGDNIKNNLYGLVSNRILKKTFSILHPYNFTIQEKLQEIKDDNKLIIGAIGTQMLSKNSQCIYKLAKRFEVSIMRDEIIFRTIGKVLPELDSYKSDLVENLYSSTFVSQEQFEIEISKLSFVIFFYDDTAYELCASGAIFEVIRMGIPIISIENDFFRWLFNTFGEMGFLCKDIDSLEEILKGLKQGSFKNEIDVFKNNISHFKIQNDLKNIALNMKPLL
ncbi:hypothetical protein [Flavobacterium sp.]|uniref:hypothetical protein n=1 Tax=Flavobacterium sp. TaxID=239 RepID=UPI0031E1ECE2